MAPRDFKTLVVGFLVLATLVGGSTYLMAAIYQRPAPAKPAAVLPASSVPTDTPRNAFVEPIPDPLLFSLPATSTAASIADSLLPATSTNLTDALAANLVQEIAVANPGGLVTQPDGQVGLVPPDFDNAATGVAARALSQNITLPDWSVEAKTLVAQIKTKKTYGPGDVRIYSAAIERILDKNLVQTNLNELASLTQAKQPIGFAAPYLDRALQQTLRSEVPEPLANYHRSLIALLVYARDMVALTDEVNDPLRMNLVMQANDPTVTLALEEYRRELDRAAAIERAASRSDHSTLRTMSARLFGLPTAHAQWIVTDIKKFIHDLLKDIKTYIKTLATETLKDQLVHRLVMQTIKWVQGEGKPKFVTNFTGFLKDEANRQVGQAIEEIMPNFCTGLVPLLQIAKIEQQAAYDTPPGCTLDRVVQNVDQFYDSFESGGFVAYGESLKPSNNIFGAMIEVSDRVQAQVDQGKDSASKDASAGQGFLSTKECVDSTTEPVNIYEAGGTTPARAQILVNANKQKEGFVRMDKCEGTPGEEDYQCWFTYCDPNGYEATTPGKTIAGAMDSAIGSPVHRIVNAEDFTALVSALVNSGLNKLMAAGVKGMRGMFQGATAADRVGASPGGGGPTPNACDGIVDPQELEDCRQMNSNVDRASNPPPIPSGKEAIVQSMNELLTKLSDTARNDNDWLDSASSAVAALNDLKNKCPNQDANGAITGSEGKIQMLQSLGGNVQVELDNVLRNSTEFSAKRDELNQAASTTQIQAVVDWMNAARERSAEYIAGLETESKNRLERLRNLNAAIAANLAPAPITQTDPLTGAPIVTSGPPSCNQTLPAP
ncbi:MAG: hypothetical protein HY978_01435 [Candidatus Liptonbacteria bacterium]|nr:hypothetical protein [Candidatus Liptonbacteria bacterium]